MTWIPRFPSRDLVKAILPFVPGTVVADAVRMGFAVATMDRINRVDRAAANVGFLNILVFSCSRNET